MRRPAVLTFALVLVASALFGLTAGLGAAPRELAATACTPSSERIATELNGVTIERFGRGDPAAIAPYTFRLSRATFEPGATVPEDCYLGSAVIVVERGELELTAAEGVALLTPGAGESARAGLADCTADCAVTLPERLTLQTGDSIYLENARYALLNGASDDAVVWVSALSQDELHCPPCGTWP